VNREEHERTWRKWSGGADEGSESPRHAAGEAAVSVDESLEKETQTLRARRTEERTMELLATRSTARRD